MAPREAIIRSEEVGGSPEGADKLVKTHENIEKSIKQQVLVNEVCSLGYVSF